MLFILPIFSIYEVTILPGSFNPVQIPNHNKINKHYNNFIDHNEHKFKVLMNIFVSHIDFFLGTELSSGKTILNLFDQMLEKNNHQKIHLFIKHMQKTYLSYNFHRIYGELSKYRTDKNKEIAAISEHFKYLGPLYDKVDRKFYKTVIRTIKTILQMYFSFVQHSHLTNKKVENYKNKIKF